MKHNETQKYNIPVNPPQEGITNTTNLRSLGVDHYPFVEPINDSTESIPRDIHLHFGDVFKKSGTATLLPHRPFDCQINLEPGSRPTYGKIYNLTKEEEQVMKSWIDENIEKGAIKPSNSPFGAPCFFVKKKSGDLRLCMDYRALNQITIKDRYPLPLISDLLGTLGGNQYFTTLDLRGAYELFRIKAGDEHKTAFLTKFGQFEFRVMPYGLSNAPPQFQAFMNDLFREQRGKCVLVYLDDIVVYGNELAQHKKDVNFVLQILCNNKLYCKPEKCHFYKQSISYLGYIISSSGLEMDPSKISSITEWPTPKSVKDIQTLLGFTNFYRGFIPHYSKLTLPLTALLKKDNKFQWTAITEQALTDLKGEFLKQTILAHPDENKPFLLETDASDFAISGILSQKDGATGIRPVAFYSRQMVPAERNYKIYDKELLAIVECFRHWRHFLQGGKHKISVISDHKNLEYFMTTKRLTRRHARWALTLSEFDFEISYRPGSRNAKADHLSRRPDYHIKEEPSTLIRLLQPNNFTSIIATEINVPTGNSFYSPIRKENIDLDSDWPLIVEDFLHADTWPTELPEQILKRCERETNLFTYDDLSRFCRLTENGKSTAEYCPKYERTKILKRFHDGAAHLKYDSIKDNLKRYYW
ncbi:hypothetical protein BASA83_002898 [Batrachochytrium salamandrivorans]|nr:hypothetical protein BASA62_004132 [Batrachochytrium salamandrivorans]KAH9245458.1 hypothetical protein BASA81_017056 [Batrachochytrium salamandrivorans]KAH9274701.1 hypothetical protein BASA83_002898 [Batrachochytrium salamandrivorans]